MAEASCRRELELEIPAEEVSKKMESVAKEFARLATIPGFRKGKAPVSLIRRRFAEDIKGEVLQTLVRYVGEEHAAVFLSSHQLSDIDQIADHVAIIDRGRAVIGGSLDDIRDRYRRVQIVFDKDAPAIPFRTPGIIRTRRDGRVLSVLTSAGADAISAEVRAFDPVSIGVLPLTLKEIFLESVTTSVNAEN